MFELLLVDRPRKPVGPEDDISGDYNELVSQLGCVYPESKAEPNAA
jgi:hypothetical protein